MASFPRKVARTGPRAAARVIRYSFAATCSTAWHPGMHAFSTSGSLSASHAVGRSMGRCRCPVNSMAKGAREIRERGEVVHRQEGVHVRAHRGNAGGGWLEAVETQKRVHP